MDWAKLLNLSKFEEEDRKKKKNHRSDFGENKAVKLV